MKIKVHNSLLKRRQGRYALNSQVYIYVSPDDVLKIRYYRNDLLSFLTFSEKTKEFKKDTGFGENRKVINPFWLNEKCYIWKEMSE